MKIDQLPVEMLMKIFSYLPTYGEVSAVNRTFNHVACTVNSNIRLRIDQRFCKRFLSITDKSSVWKQSIISSNRQITTVDIVGDNSAKECFVIDDHDQQQIIDVVARFSDTITCLTFAHVFMDEAAVLEILSLIPNVEDLALQELCTQRQSSKRRRSNECLNLKKLQSLSIIGCSTEFVEAFHRLPVGVLTELQISCYSSTLATTLNRQFNIKNLTYIQDDFINEHDGHLPQVFDKMKLESLILCLNVMNSVTIAAILSKQTKLKCLILNRETVVDDRVMNAVASLGELEILSMNGTYTSTASLAKIYKLKNLQEFKLRCADVEGTDKIMAAFTRSPNLSLRILSWEFVFRMSVDLVGALAKSLPNLTQLNVLRCNLINGTDLDAVLYHFNFVEVLHISFWCKPSTNPRNYRNAKLRELAIFVPYADQFYKHWLSILTASYPNLRKFVIIVRFPDTRFQIQPILDGFTKLESFTLESSSTRMVVDDLNYLHEHKNNLKFVSLGHLERITLTDKLLGSLRDNFSVVNVHLDRTLTVAVDRYIMECESGVGS